MADLVAGRAYPVGLAPELAVADAAAALSVAAAATSAPDPDVPPPGAAAPDLPPATGATTAAVATTLPMAAIAHTAMFARIDRAHGIVRDVLQTPATTTAAPQPDAAAPPPARITGPPPRDTPSAVWINLGRAQEPVWIDLATTRGLGLDGPGALDIARTIWHRLADLQPAAMLIVPHELARHLLGHIPRPGAEDRGPHVTLDPHQGLQAAWDALDRRRATGHPAAPVVLIAPAPATPAGRSDLVQTLQHYPAAAFAAVLLGQWDTGTTLTITDAHHVSNHQRPAPTLPLLTGARLEPTTLDPPHAPTPPAPDQPAPPGEPAPAEPAAPGEPAPTDEPPAAEPEPPPAGVADPAAPIESRTQRTPLALTVLGAVQLRYRRPTDTDTDRQPPEEEILAVPGISRPAREMLAYLAAHPGGATRDAIIEALWPTSTADRPDTAFHATISRLRKRLRDTTRIPTTGEIISSVDGRYHLNRAQVTVDYWTFLETHPRNTDRTLRRHDHYIAVQLYQGPFAADLTGEWAHTIREATRRRYLEAINDLIETEATTNPDLALQLLERARNLEPLNEAIYRNIMRIHLRNNRKSAARNTYELLRVHLSGIDESPEQETESLALRCIR